MGLNRFVPNRFQCEYAKSVSNQFGIGLACPCEHPQWRDPTRRIRPLFEPRPLLKNIAVLTPASIYTDKYGIPNPCATCMLCNNACQMWPLTLCIDSSCCLCTDFWLWWHIPAHPAPVSSLSAHLRSCGDGDAFYEQSLLVPGQKDILSTVVSDFCLSAYRLWSSGGNPKPLDARKVGMHAVGADGMRQTVQD